MKTGTTFLQTLMFDNREQLAAAGILFPGKTWARQVRAVQDVLYPKHKDPRIRAGASGVWDALAEEMRSHRGTAAVLSMEFLSFADAQQVDRVVTSLEPADVHVILTVRDATATIPAQWQTTVRSGQTISWPDFTRGIRKATGVQGRLGRFTDPALVKFRRTQDIARMLETWGRTVPPERLHVVTVPPPGASRRLLWERFAHVIGLDPEVCASGPAANESLGYPSAEVLRRVNAALGPLPASDYNATLRQHLARGILAPRSTQERRARLDRETLEFGLEWNRRTRAAVRDAGAQVVGDLEELPTTATQRHESEIEDAQPPPTDDELLAAAATAVEGMRDLVARRARRARNRGLDVNMSPHDHPPATPETWARSGDPVAAAVADIAELCRTSIDLQRRLRA